eukprot:2963267-Rhodomonas_salina.4
MTGRQVCWRSARGLRGRVQALLAPGAAPARAGPLRACCKRDSEPAQALAGKLSHPSRSIIDLVPPTLVSGSTLVVAVVNQRADDAELFLGQRAELNRTLLKGTQIILDPHLVHIYHNIVSSDRGWQTG